MSEYRFQEWQPIRIFGQGLQPRLGKHWNCEVAWDLTAVYRQPDGEIPHPDFFRAQAGSQGEFPNRNGKCFVFWNRHIDRRFHLEYPLPTRQSPRAQGKTIGDSDEEWDTVVAWRDRIARDAGVDLEGPPQQLAKALADSFLYDLFEKKPLCTTFADSPRQLNHGVEGLLHKSYCTGCAKAFVLLCEVSALPARAIGCIGHYVAEVQLEGKWYIADSVGRHPPGNIDAFFRGSYLDTVLDPMGAWAPRMSDDLRNGLWRRPNGQYHFTSGMWDGPCALRYAASNAYALYPGNGRWGFKSSDGKRLPILNRTGGFYWSSVHSSDGADARILRQAALPMPISDQPASRDYLYHPFRPGQKLRQSVWLDAVEDVECFELDLAFGASKISDFSSGAGQNLLLRIGDFEASLAELAAWPPRQRGGDGETAAGSSGEVLLSSIRLRPDVFRAHSVNWIELVHQGKSLYYMPCLPAVLEPYIPPLWSETDLAAPEVPRQIEQPAKAATVGA